MMLHWLKQVAHVWMLATMVSLCSCETLAEVHLDMYVPLSLSFDTLKVNETLLLALTSSLETALKNSMATTVAQRLLLPTSQGGATGSLTKISRLPSNQTTAVSALFRLTVPSGATTAQITALMSLASGDTAFLFKGSPYISYLMGAANVTYVESPKTSFSTGEVVGISVGAALATFALVFGAFGLHRWRVYKAILPKKPAGKWDPTGVEGVAIKPGARQRLKHRQGEVVEGSGAWELQQPQAGSSSAAGAGNGGGGGVVVGPWNGASGLTSGSGSSVNGVKSEAALVPSKPAWS